MAYIGFTALKNKLADRPGVTNPAALAASIGRKKYGSKAMARASSLGRKKGHGAAEAFIKGLRG